MTEKSKKVTYQQLLFFQRENDVLSNRVHTSYHAEIFEWQKKYEELKKEIEELKAVVRKRRLCGPCGGSGHGFNCVNCGAVTEH